MQSSQSTHERRAIRPGDDQAVLDAGGGERRSGAPR